MRDELARRNLHPSCLTLICLKTTLAVTMKHMKNQHNSKSEIIEIKKKMMPTILILTPKTMMMTKTKKKKRFTKYMIDAVGQKHLPVVGLR